MPPQPNHLDPIRHKVLDMLRIHCEVRELPGAGLRGHVARDIFALWEDWERALGVSLSEPPFWGVVWPAAWGLGRWLAQDGTPVQGKRLLDLGCGSGLGALAAVKAGAAQVIANDIDPAALLVTTMHAELNGLQVDLDDTDRLASGTFAEADIILVADMFYHRAHSDRLDVRLTEFHQQGGTVWVADGSRTYAPQAGKLLWEETLPVDKGVEGVTERRVRIWQWEPTA